MAVPRSHQFNPNLDPELLRSIEAAAGSFKPYRAELRSGYRPGDPRQHGKGEALDIQLYDPKTGAPLDAYQGGGQAAAYQQFANQWYSSLSPEQQAKARWGGYFGNPTDPTYGRKYGDQDYMHFDFGRTPELGMLGGDWSTGFKPEAVKALGLSGAGGIGALVGGAAADQMKQAGYSDDQIRAAFLSTVAGTEAPGYNTLYGGGSFGDYSQHPNRRMPIMSGPNKGDYSTAAGRYQMLHDTWAGEQAKLGLKDFSPTSQDAAAWDLAATGYQGATKGDLMEALKSGDPGRINAAAAALNKTWTSLPGGIEQGKRYGTSTFADAYTKALSGAKGPSGPVEAAGGGAGNEAGPAGPATPATAAAVPWWQKLAEGIGKGGGAMADKVGGFNPVQSRSGAIPAARMDAGEIPTIDPQQQEMQRQQLAMAMARLNSGKLYG